MAPNPDKLAYVFAMVLAMALTIVAITTWAAPPNPESYAAAPVASKQPIYRPDRWVLY